MSAADGPEVQITPAGNLEIIGRACIGGIDAAGSGLTRDGATDRLFADKDCDGTKDAGEEFIDEGVSSVSSLNATGADIHYNATRDCFYQDTNENGSPDGEEPCVNQPKEIRYAENYLGGGSDYGVAVNAAYADCIADGNDGCFIAMPRSESWSQSTPIDLCDLSGEPPARPPVTLYGHGSNAGGAAGTGLIATSSLRPAATTGTFSVSADSGFGGRDVITGLDFKAAGYNRGDYITTSGFTDAANNITDSEMPLVVFRAESTKLVLEGHNSQDAGLVTRTEGGGQSIQRLVFQIRTCSRNMVIQGINFDGTSSKYADFGWVAWADNFPWYACLGSANPYPLCNGDGTSTNTNAVAVKMQYFRHSAALNHKWASVVVGSTNAMGQGDHTTIENAEIGRNSKIGLWADNGQVFPQVIAYNSVINTFEKYGIYVTAGGVDGTELDVISGNADCRADTYGECWYYYNTPANVRDTVFRNSVFEVNGGRGLFVDQQISGFKYTFTLDNVELSTTYTTGTPSTPVKLLEYKGAGLLTFTGLRLNNNQSGITASPTLTVSNANQATTPLRVSASYTSGVTSGATFPPVVTINDGIPDDASLLLRIAAKTTNYNVTDDDCKRGVLTNLGAGGGVTFTLPPNPTAGLECKFVTATAQAVTVDPQGASGCTPGASCDQILALTTAGGKFVTGAATVGTNLNLIAIDADKWVPQVQLGTWTPE